MCILCSSDSESELLDTWLHEPKPNGYILKLWRNCDGCNPAWVMALFKRFLHYTEQLGFTIIHFFLVELFECYIKVSGCWFQDGEISKTESHCSVERPVFLFTAMDFNSSISLLLITGNLESSGHAFHCLKCQEVFFQLLRHRKPILWMSVVDVWYKQIYKTFVWEFRISSLSL